MFRLTILLVVAFTFQVHGKSTGIISDSQGEHSYLGSAVIAAPVGHGIGVDYGLGGAGIAVGPAVAAAPIPIGGPGLSGHALNTVLGALGASHLIAIQNTQAATAAQIGHEAAAEIQGARATEVAARAGQANAILNAQAHEGQRLVSIERAQIAAAENARASEAARCAAAAATWELARATEAERAANAARVQTIAIANARAVEASRIANSARSQAAAVAASAAQTQAIADAVARQGNLLTGGGSGYITSGAVLADPAVVGGPGYAVESYGGMDLRGLGWAGRYDN